MEQKYTIQELKVMAFDTQVQIQTLNQQLNQIVNMIAEQSKPEEATQEPVVGQEVRKRK